MTSAWHCLQHKSLLGIQYSHSWIPHWYAVLMFLHNDVLLYLRTWAEAQWLLTDSIASCGCIAGRPFTGRRLFDSIQHCACSNRMTSLASGKCGFFLLRCIDKDCFEARFFLLFYPSLRGTCRSTSMDSQRLVLENLWSAITTESICCD